MRPLLCTLTILAASASFCRLCAQEKSSPSPKTGAAIGEVEKTTAAKPLDAADIDVLRANVGQEKTVRGKIIRAKDWDGGPQKKKPMNFLDFEGGHFKLVTFADDYPNFPDGRPAKLYLNKTVEVTGKIEEFQGNYQIKLKSPDQIKVVEDSKAGDKGGKDDRSAGGGKSGKETGKEKEKQSSGKSGEKDSSGR